MGRDLPTAINVVGTPALVVSKVYVLDSYSPHINGVYTWCAVDTQVPVGYQPELSNFLISNNPAVCKDCTLIT